MIFGLQYNYWGLFSLPMMLTFLIQRIMLKSYLELWMRNVVIYITGFVLTNYLVLLLKLITYCFIKPKVKAIFPRSFHIYLLLMLKLKEKTHRSSWSYDRWQLILENSCPGIWEQNFKECLEFFLQQVVFVLTCPYIN